MAVSWYRTVVRFPMSGQDKWQGTNDLMVQVVQADMHSEGNLQRSLELAAARWMWRRSDWLTDSTAPVSALDDVLVATFKTLNMPTQVRVVNGTMLKATTFYCPFIEHTRRGEPFARRICEQVCSEQHSLFKGLTQGLPMAVMYVAPQKMGCGDDTCVKVFLLPSDQE